MAKCKHFKAPKSAFSGSARKAWLTKGHGKLSGRVCVVTVVERPAKAKNSKKGACLSNMRFFGCFTSKAKAEARMKQVANRKSIK